MANFNLPVGADPNRDTPWGTDELGFPQFRTASGTIYSARPQVVPPRQSQPGTMDRAVEVAKGYVTDALQGLLGAATAPRRALEGGDGVTPADALNLAGLLQLGGAAATKPAGALGANSLRSATEPQRRMTLWHGSPYDFDQFDLAHIGRGEGAQDLGRGFSLTDSQGEAILYTNPASRWGDLAAMERYRKAGPGRYYRVDINAAPEQFLDWNKPWREQVPEGTPLYDSFAKREAVMLSQYPDDPAMQAAIPRAKVFQMWRDNAGFEDAATQSGFVGNKQRNYSGDTQYTVFDPSLLRIDKKFDADGNILSANRDATTGAIALAAPRNEAEAMARQILEMRAQGRAGDVTDAMMAQADPQYMYANTPLPMDEASRMARAREAGFQGGLLHGTGSDISAVDPSRLGEKQNVLGKGFYQTTSPERSERYVPKAKDEAGKTIFAEGGNVMPLMSRSADEFDLTAPTGKQNISRIAKVFEGTDFKVDLRDGGDSVFIQSKTDPKMSVFLDSYQEGQSTLMRLKDAFGNNNLTPILEDAGFTGLKGAEGRGSSVRVNYNPSDLRSRFARFDPEFSHLANLNAANVSPEVGLLATQPTEADIQDIMRYLGAQGLLR